MYNAKTLFSLDSMYFMCHSMYFIYQNSITKKHNKNDGRKKVEDKHHTSKISRPFENSANVSSYKEGHQLYPKNKKAHSNKIAK